MRIYLAASLFTPFERERNLRVAASLRDAGYEVFLPQLIRTAAGERPEAATIFEACADGVVESDAVVGLVDGPDVDSGTAWELGYAFAMRKPIVTLRTDYRRAEHGSVNIMLEFSSDASVVIADPASTEVVAVQKLVEALQSLPAQRDGRSTRGGVD